MKWLSSLAHQNVTQPGRLVRKAANIRGTSSASANDHTRCRASTSLLSAPVEMSDRARSTRAIQWSRSAGDPPAVDCRLSPRSCFDGLSTSGPASDCCERFPLTLSPSKGERMSYDGASVASGPASGHGVACSDQVAAPACTHRRSGRKKPHAGKARQSGSGEASRAKPNPPTKRGAGAPGAASASVSRALTARAAAAARPRRGAPAVAIVCADPAASIASPVAGCSQ